jgi:hypothetical protein
MKMIRGCSFAATFWVAAMAYAAEIPVPDFSFEEPDLAEGTLGTVPGWTALLVGGGGTPRVRDPANAQYAGSTGNNALLPGSALGGQAAYFAFTENGSGMTTTLAGTTVQANTLYTLTAALGDPLDRDPGTVFLRLTLNGTVAATTTILPTSIPSGTFTDFSVALGPFASNDLRVGETLGIELRMSGGFRSGGYGADFDNIRLTSAVPEPTALSAFACIGLLRRRRRSRSLYQLPRLS